MKCPRLKTTAIVVFFVYLISIGISYYMLHKSHDEFTKIKPYQVLRHMKSHRRPEQLRIGHPLFESCLRDENYERLLLEPYHSLGNIHVYSAFLDNRTGVPHARMISMVNSRARNRNFKLWCHFGFSRNNTLRVSREAVFYEMCENHHFSNGGWIISCQIPVEILQRIPCELFLKETNVSKDSYPSIMVPLLKTDNHNRPRKKGRDKFGLCVPPLYGTIETSKLIKFLSLTNTLGIDHLIFYVYNITTELNSVLEYLEDRGTVTIIPWVLPIDSNHVWYYGQSIAINDCLYRSMFYLDYLAFTDLDEYIVSHIPKISLSNFIDQQKSKNNKIAAYRFSSSFFIRNPEAKGNNSELDVMDHIYRTDGVSRIRSKLIVEPYKIFEVGIHHVSRTWPDSHNYTTFEVDPEDAIVHHYRNCIPTLDLGCSSFITDSTVPDWHQYYFTTRFNARMAELKLKFNITPG